MVKDNFVDVYNIKEGITVREVVKKYQEGKLKRITTPTHPVEEDESAES